MPVMNTILENSQIEELTRVFERSPIQLNGPQEADAEILLLPSTSDNLLAVTTDSLAEEIASGLYDDVYLAGWMSVMANMSDLAAVGASPLGLLVSEILPQNLGQPSIQRLQQGIQDACRVCGTHVLGGDTNSGERLVMTGTALGICRRNAYLSRIGAKPGDLLYATGRLGAGNAFALHRFSHASSPGLPGFAGSGPGVGKTPGDGEIPADGIGRIFRYRPFARLHEGKSLCGIATACMDTSDGVIATLDQLMRLNRSGFELTDRWESLLDPAAREEFEAHRLPAWAALAGQHGEFELLFTLPRDQREVLMEASSRAGWEPLELGTVIAGKAVVIPLEGRQVEFDTAYLRNLSSVCGSDVQSYVRALLAYDAKIQKGVDIHVNA
jgi:thiamine-monophosphate kinase